MNLTQKVMEIIRKESRFWGIWIFAAVIMYVGITVYNDWEHSKSRQATRDEIHEIVASQEVVRDIRIIQDKILANQELIKEGNESLKRNKALIEGSIKDLQKRLTRIEEDLANHKKQTEGSK